MGVGGRGSNPICGYREKPPVIRRNAVGTGQMSRYFRKWSEYDTTRRAWDAPKDHVTQYTSWVVVRTHI